MSAADRCTQYVFNALSVEYGPPSAAKSNVVQQIMYDHGTESPEWAAFVAASHDYAFQNAVYQQGMSRALSGVQPLVTHTCSNTPDAP